jgi:hypothetical protein
LLVVIPAFAILVDLSGDKMRALWVDLAGGATLNCAVNRGKISVKWEFIRSAALPALIPLRVSHNAQATV